MRVLVLDNGDRFTPKLVKALEALDAECEVRPPEGLSLARIRALKPKRILIAPGPGRPEDTGVCKDVVQHLAGDIPVFGICLGMQVIALVAGSRMSPPRRALKRKATSIRHDGKGIFEAIPTPFAASRYPSLVVDGSYEPTFLEFSAWAEEDNAVVGLRLSGLGIEGVQLDPKLFLTDLGSDLLFNFIYRSQAW